MEDTEQKDETLTVEITSNKPETSISLAQLSPKVASCHRKTKLYSQMMKKVLPPVNALIRRRNPAAEVPNYTKTFIVLMTEDKEF